MYALEKKLRNQLAFSIFILRVNRSGVSAFDIGFCSISEFYIHAVLIANLKHQNLLKFEIQYAVITAPKIPMQR